MLPCVDEQVREQVSREFDDRGPTACVAAISEEMRTANPEVFDMAQRCSRDVGDSTQIMVGLCMFYRLLSAQAQQGSASDITWVRHNSLPQVRPDTRDLITREIDRSGPEAFTQCWLDALEHDNPQLLLMSHLFAAKHNNYLGIMQGFALIYACLESQSKSDQARLH